MPKQDREALLLGLYQSVLLGVLMKYYGAVAGLMAMVPFLVGLGFVGFAVGARAPEDKNPVRRQTAFIACAALLVLLLVSRLYYVNLFKAFFTQKAPVFGLAMFALSVALAVKLFAYAGWRYAAALKQTERPVWNYALLAAGFAGGTAVFGLASGIGGQMVYTPDILALFVLFLAPYLTDLPNGKKASGAMLLVCVAVMVFAPKAYFKHISFSWGADNPRHVADQWSPYYKIDAVALKNDTVLCGLYNYTCMLIAVKNFDDLEAAAAENEALYEAAMPAGARRALIMGSGGGMKHPALFRDSMESVTAVEIDPVIVSLMRNRFPDYNRGFYSDPRVRAVVAEGRAFLRRDTSTYDYIEYESLDTRLYATAMNVVPVENRLFTRGGLAAAYARLAPDGVMRISIGTEDAHIISAVVSSLPQDAHYDVYRVIIDMGRLLGLDRARVRARLAGWSQDMPQTAVLVAKSQQPLARAQKRLEQMNLDPKKIKRLSAPRRPGAALTDDRPFFGGPRMGGAAVALLLGGLFAAMLVAGRVAGVRKDNVYFYLVGAGYAALEVSLVAQGVRGALNPAAAALVMMTLFLAGNVCANLLAERAAPRGPVLLGAAVLLLPAVVGAAAVEGLPLWVRAAACAVAGLLGGLFWPAGLSRISSARRGPALAADALGSLPGIIVFHVALYAAGYQAAAAAAAVLFLCAGGVFVIGLVGGGDN